MKVLSLLRIGFLFSTALLSLVAVARPVSAASFVVAADGSGDFRTVGEAINKVPENNKKRVVIHIKPGTYDEQIRVPASKPYVTFRGDAAEKTVLTFKLTNNMAGSTSAAYATYIGGHDFHAENITFENSWGRPAGPNQQAVAVVAEADRLVFKNCRFLGWQDTLYAKGGRQYYKDSYIEGSVDFIFGQGAAVFENCTIHSKTAGYIAAPMRFGADEPSGYVFLRSKLTGQDTGDGVFLARPWRAFGRTVFLETEMGAHIRSEGWNNWGNAANEKTAYFAEYDSRGAGAQMDKRAAWMHKLNATDAKQFYPENFLKWKDGWDAKKSTDNWAEKTPPVWKLVSWREVFDQQLLWYATDEAARIGDQLVLFQKENGGWEKNRDFSFVLTQKEKEELAAKRADTSETTIDNRTTYTQVAYLARLTSASLTKSSPPHGFQKHKDAFFKGLDYLLTMQYANGGFPQFYPLREGYYSHITFNDDAMIGVMTVLDDIAKKKPDYKFVDEARRERAERAVQKGVEAILKTQVVINGKRTAWCAQHDEMTFAPIRARTYELPSLSGYESVGIVRFLMSIENPNAEIKDAINAAVDWFGTVKLTGIKVTQKGNDHVVVKDKNAPPLWARFYDLKTNKPMFVGRDGVVKNSLVEIEAERRNGYAWYVNSPEKLLSEDYPKWKRKNNLPG